MTDDMRRLGLRALLCVGMGMALGSAALAQGIAAGTAGAMSERIQSLVSRDGAGAARRLVDSVLARAMPSDAEFGMALYWRARLVTTPDSARRDLLRVAVEHPFAPFMEDALVRLADNELRAGDRVSARRHLERMVRDNLATDNGARAAYQLAQMMFDEGETLQACDVLDSARTHLSRGNVELANQIEYAGRGCAQERAAKQATTTDRVAAVHADSAARGSVQGVASKGSTARGSTSDTGRWSVQVAAFAARAEALRMAARLSSRGYAARVTTAKPYRVRIGRFSSRAEASEVAARLKAENTTAIVVEAERP